MCSALLPLHEGLIVSTDGEESGVTGAEHDTDDVLGVTSETLGLALDAWVVEEVDETVVITGGEELFVLGATDGVDVGTIGALGVDTLGLPEELAGDGGPLNILEVGSAAWVLRAVLSSEEEELVGTTVGADELGVSAPVEGHDVRVVASACAAKGPVGGVVDVDIVVMGTDGKHLVVWGESHNLDPLSRIFHALNLGIQVRGSSDGNGTVVTGDSNEGVVDGNATRALRVWELGESGGLTSLRLLSSVGDLGDLAAGAGVRVPGHDLVIITRGVDSASGILSETPDLTIGVRLHDVSLAAGGINDRDGTVTLSNEHVGAIGVNGADKGVELNSVGDRHGRAVNDVDLTILGTRVELALEVSQGADETLVHVHGLLTSAAIITTPAVDLTVGATSVALAIIVPSCASEGSLLVATEETLLFVTISRGTIPEVDVLDTSSGDSLGAWLGVPADIMDLVGITLGLEAAVATGIIDVDLVLVVKIDSSDPAFFVDSNSCDTTGSLGDLYSLFLLTSAGIPGEDGGLGANLTGGSGVAGRVESDAHNIISVVIGVIGDVLGSAIDLTTTEEFLGVAVSVENDTESGGHVDSLASTVEVDVLLGVSASVTIDVLELVASRRRVVIHRIMLSWLLNLANPGAHSHELLTLSLFNFEEIVLTTIIVFTTVT